MNTDLIEVSDDEMYIDIKLPDQSYQNSSDDNDDIINKINKNITTQYDRLYNELYFEDIDVEDYEITLIKKGDIKHSDQRITDFVKMCVDRKLFDNTFYDYGNKYSIIATKLPPTFDKLSTDGKIIKKDVFCKYFKKNYNYDKDINFIFETISENKKYATREEFMEFFIQFVNNVTI